MLVIVCYATLFQLQVFRELFHELKEPRGLLVTRSLKENNVSQSVSLVKVEVSSIVVVKNNTKLTNLILCISKDVKINSSTLGF